MRRGISTAVSLLRWIYSLCCNFRILLRQI